MENKVKIMHNRRNGKTGFYKSLNPMLFEYCFESEVTNGLGYEPINHHEDSQEGLIRHLLEMDLREMEREHTVYKELMNEMVSQVFILDGDRNFYKHIAFKLLEEAKHIPGGVFINEEEMVLPDGVFISTKIMKNLIPKRNLRFKGSTKNNCQTYVPTPYKKKSSDK